MITETNLKTSKITKEMQKQIDTLTSNLKELNTDINQIDKKLEIFCKDVENTNKIVLGHSEKLVDLPNILNRLDNTLSLLSQKFEFNNTIVERLEGRLENIEKKLNGFNFHDIDIRISDLEKFRFKIIGVTSAIVFIILLVFKIFFGA